MCKCDIHYILYIYICFFLTKDAFCLSQSLMEDFYVNQQQAQRYLISTLVFHKLLIVTSWSLKKKNEKKINKQKKN